MSESQRERQPLLSSQSHDRVAVWPIVHMIRGDVTVSGLRVIFAVGLTNASALDSTTLVNTPLTFEALTAPDLTYTLVRPLEEKYNAIQQAGNKSVVFCFLLNRTYFTRDQNVATGPLSSTRAALCELLAIRLLRDNGNSILDLAIALTTCWPVWTGADPHIIQMAKEERDGDLEDRVGNALEMAIISRARRFIKSSPCQKVIDEIWIGRCVYQAESSHSILSDRYKRTPIHFYDPHKAPLLDHYRLKVPAIRSVLDYVNFLILFILFVIAIETNESDRINTPELVFMVCGLGFTLEKLAAMQEHGIKVYSKGTWNGFDIAFGQYTVMCLSKRTQVGTTVTTYSVYAFFRIYGVVYHKHWARGLGTDFLAVIACLLFPRLAFVTLQNNLMVLSLRAMMMQFVALMLIAAFCFCGFLYALWTLSRKGASYSAGTIAWWMLDLWFGLDASGFDRAFEFDVVFGPILMITYACLSNTLLLTVLVSILSNTFARINEDAAAEAMFRRAVSVLEGVKADSLFSYQPPINYYRTMYSLSRKLRLVGKMVPQAVKDKRILDKGDKFPDLTDDRMVREYVAKSSSCEFNSSLLKDNGSYPTHADFMIRYQRLQKRSGYAKHAYQPRRPALFEGLAGSDADIDIIFEVVEDSEEAVDTENYADPPLPQTALQRQISRKSDSRPSRSPLRPSRSRKKRTESHRTPSPSTNQSSAAPRPSEHTRHPLTPAGLRRRLNSMFNKTDTVQSPLAQVFQPVVVDDDIPEEHDSDKGVSLQPHSSNGHIVSYGPASRRRLTSMHLMSKRGADSAVQSSDSSQRPAFPAIDTRPEALAAGPLSASPNRQPETVEQVEETMQNSGGMVELSERIKDMEDRQKRIEDILIQLLARLQN
ncbi:hypothetical protein EDD17DRAFT_1804828 [Pisolithus thermaeus]|nr:hypothetical protein EDD17DRAFT_1804828 [Pisolithus thermaeus]